MRFLRQTLLGMMLVAAVIATPAAAQADWPLEGERSAPLVEFGASYVESGTATVHHGVDLAARTGQQVLAPLAGKVTFVGRVPGARGTTVLALTMLTASGSITLLPLDRAAVSRGDEVSQGDSIATLADAGDPSSAVTHLHVGRRTGSLYLDPASVLGPVPATAAEPEGVKAEAVAVVPAAEPVADVHSLLGSSGASQVGAGSAVGGAEASGLSGSFVTTPRVSGGAHVPAATTAPVAHIAPPAVEPAATLPRSFSREVVGHVGTVAEELAPGVSLASGAGAPARGFELTGVVAETGETLTAGGRLARVASSAISEGRLGPLASRGIQAAKRGARSAALAAVGVLCALGALWPLWRAGGLEGPVKVSVSAVREDVAAVASR